MNYLQVILLLFVVNTAAWAEQSHCTAQEDIVFSCRVGKKILSVCASKTISPTTGYVQYRFGSIDKAEMRIPATTTMDKSAIKTQNLMFSGGGGATMRFINGAYDYVVYSAIGKGWGTKDGLLVKKQNKRKANWVCDDIPVSQMSVDFFNKAGLLEDNQEFELP